MGCASCWCYDKASVKRGPWSPEEDELLRSGATSGATAPPGPQRAGPNRRGKSCRLRWLNYLGPDIKHGGYTDQEDLVISLYNSIGSRWSIIASKLPGRSDNDVKNYWNTKIKKKAMAMHQQQHHYHHHGAGGRGHARGATIATPPPAPPSQCAGPYMQLSPTSASSASGDACSFGVTMYSPSHSHQAQAQLAHYNVTAATAPLAEFSAVAAPAAASSWAINMALDDMFLPELVGGGDLFGGFGPLLLQDNRASASLQELLACYFPNAQAEMWAAAADVKPPPGAGLCPSLT